MKVKNMESASGREVPNQFEITDDAGVVWFQSYRTIIAKFDHGETTLDSAFWDYSRTTGKRETERKIKSGEYKLANLN